MTKYRLVNVQEQKDGGYVLTVEHLPGRMEKLFGEEPRRVQYYGNCNVWREMSTFVRCSSGMERILTNYWAKIRNDEKENRKK